MDSIQFLEEQFESGNKLDALKKLKLIADSGSPQAMLVYASLLDDYADGETEYGDEIISYFKLALEAGELGASFHLGSIYKEGAYTAENSSLSKKYYSIGADGGEPDCMEELADILSGETPPNYHEAFKWYVSAINSGNSCHEKCMKAIINGKLSGVDVDNFKESLTGKALKPFLMALGLITISVVLILTFQFLFE